MMEYKPGQPTGNELTQLALDVLQVWKRFGRALGLDEADLIAIAADEHDIYERSHAMLIKWTQKNGGQATYAQLAEGLLNPTLQPSRRDLVKKYCVEEGHSSQEAENGTETGLPSETADEPMLRAAVQELSINGADATPVLLLPGEPYHETYKREKEIQQIDRLYESITNRGSNDVITVYLTGPPGSGKSQLSRQYGEWYGQRQTNSCGCVVATLHAETAESLLESYRLLARALNLAIPAIGEDVRKKLDAFSCGVKAYLSSVRVQWLVIVDNVEGSAPLKEFWPGRDLGWGVGRVLVTTQDAELAPSSSAHARSLSLSRGMEEADAVDLMCLIADVRRSVDAVEVARKVDYYPLSLACAAVFIKDMRTHRPAANYQWTDYLVNLEEYFERIEYSEYTEHNRCYPHSMLPAAYCAAKRMATNSAILSAAFEFLSHCALQPIPLDVVSKHVIRACATSIPDVVKRHVAKCQLLIYPVSGARGIEVITMHQVMRAAFVQLRRESRDHCAGACVSNPEGEAVKMREKTSLEYSLETMNSCYERYNKSLDQRGVSIRILISPHLHVCIDTARQRDWVDTETFISGSVCLADSLVHVAGATDTQRVHILEKAREVLMRLGLRSLSACQLLSDLGYTYREAGHLDKAFMALEEASVIAESRQGREWMEQRSHILNILAWTYRETFQLDMAAAYMETSVELTKQVCGPTRDTQVVERLCNLGIILHDAWNNHHALRVLGEARDIVDSLGIHPRGAIHAQVLNYTAKVHLRWYLGLIYTEGKTKRAAEHLYQSKLLHEQALEIYERLHGKRHKFYAGTAMTYGMVLRHYGELQRAREHCAFALEIYRASGHIAWPRVATWLADIYLVSGEYEAVKILLEDVLNANQEFGLTSVSPGALHPRALLAEAMVETGERAQGKEMLQGCLAEWKEKEFHPEHYWVTRATDFMKRKLCKDSI